MISTNVKHKLEKEKVSQQEIIDYYLTHSLSQTSEKFNITGYIVLKILEENNIEKHTKQENTIITNQEKYGCDNVFQSHDVKEKIKETNLEKYGVEYNWQREDVKQKIKEHCLETYGVEYTGQIEGTREKAYKTSLERFGPDNINNRKKFKQTLMEKYGVTSPLQDETIQQKAISTCMEKYGVPYNCMRPEARMRGNDSFPNRYFSESLEDNGFTLINGPLENQEKSFKREFVLGNYSFDFAIGNTLIEIDPTITHNFKKSVFNHEPIDKYYHRNKSLFALNQGYKCIHVFDWDDPVKIIKMFTGRETVYARNCCVKEVSTEETKTFLIKNHLQGFIKSQVSLGLYYNENLISIMTFGKPRYNNKYEYELLRYCSSFNVIGGAEKLFKFFIKNYNPHSIISYCDFSKFDGKTYYKLGFTCHTKNINPSVHWYNIKTKQHITDNLLRQRGFDQLFNANYGKGTSNEELMLKNGFLPVCDCGQLTFIWNNQLQK